MTTGKSTCEVCDACRRVMGLWQAAFTSECGHTFHLRCVSGAAACPVCAAPWTDTPTTAPAPAPATPFTFAPMTTPADSSSASSRAPLFGHPSSAHTSYFAYASPLPPPSSSPSPSWTLMFGQPSPSSASHQAFDLSGALYPPPPLYVGGPIPAFGQQHQAPASPLCPICHAAMRRGQATVTSECNHTFHLRCIASPFWATSVCPVCNARWRDCVYLGPPPDPFYSPTTMSSPSPSRTPMFGQTSRTPKFGQKSPSTAAQYSPFSMPGPYPPPPQSVGRIPAFGQQHQGPSSSSPVFDDDEPVSPPQSPVQQVQAKAPTNKDNAVTVMQLKTHCEHPAVARDTALDSFAVLVHAKAPPAAAATASERRAPSLDLVAVLDVSGSMAGGNKLALLKQAMGFVIDRLLGPRDRLSIVALSCEARRILRLARMSDAGKATAKALVESIVAQYAGKDIGGGLRVAAEVLDGRRHRNAVAGVILLSDGKDNRVYDHPNCISRINRYSGIVPWSLCRTLGCRFPPPVHMFGLGTDHDAEAMHAIARQTRGTFSVIETEAGVQDAMARCIGELHSVAVQEARVVVECLHPGVHVRAIKFADGRFYPRDIDMGGCAASVDFGELCADEERSFLLFLGVPVTATAAAGDGDDGSVTRLIKVRCTYTDAATGRSVEVSCEDDYAVQRPVVVPTTPTTDMELPSSCVEVARERFRVEAAEDIAAARDATNQGEHARAAQILDHRQEAAAAAAAALAGDEKCTELVAELRKLSARVADQRPEYELTGRASRVPAFVSTPAGSPLETSTSTSTSTSTATATATATGGYLLSYGPGSFSFS